MANKNETNRRIRYITNYTNKVIFIYVYLRVRESQARWFTAGIILNFCLLVYMSLSLCVWSFLNINSFTNKNEEEKENREKNALFVVYAFSVSTDVRWIKSKSATFLHFFRCFTISSLLWYRFYVVSFPKKTHSISQIIHSFFGQNWSRKKMHIIKMKES